MRAFSAKLIFILCLLFSVIFDLYAQRPLSNQELLDLSNEPEEFADHYMEQPDNVKYDIIRLLPLIPKTSPLIPWIISQANDSELEAHERIQFVKSYSQIGPEGAYSFVDKYIEDYMKENKDSYSLPTLFEALYNASTPSQTSEIIDRVNQFWVSRSSNSVQSLYELLIKIGSPKAHQSLIDHFFNMGADNEYVLEALAKAGEPKLIPIFSDIFSGEDLEAKHLQSMAKYRLDDFISAYQKKNLKDWSRLNELIPAIESFLLNAKNPNDIQFNVDDLASIKTEKAREAIHRLYKKGLSKKYIVDAIGDLEEFANEQSEDILLSLLSFDKNNLNSSIIQSLGSIKAKKSEDILIKYFNHLEDDQSYDRKTVAETLAKIGGEKSSNTLGEFLILNPSDSSIASSYSYISPRTMDEEIAKRLMSNNKVRTSLFSALKETQSEFAQNEAFKLRGFITDSYAKQSYIRILNSNNIDQFNYLTAELSAPEKNEEYTNTIIIEQLASIKNEEKRLKALELVKLEHLTVYQKFLIRTHAINWGIDNELAGFTSLLNSLEEFKTKILTFEDYSHLTQVFYKLLELNFTQEQKTKIKDFASFWKNRELPKIWSTKTIKKRALALYNKASNKPAEQEQPQINLPVETGVSQLYKQKHSRANISQYLEVKDYKQLEKIISNYFSKYESLKDFDLLEDIIKLSNEDLLYDFNYNVLGRDWFKNNKKVEELVKLQADFFIADSEKYSSTYFHYFENLKNISSESAKKLVKKFIAANNSHFDSSIVSKVFYHPMSKDMEDLALVLIERQTSSMMDSFAKAFSQKHTANWNTLVDRYLEIASDKQLDNFAFYALAHVDRKQNQTLVRKLMLEIRTKDSLRYFSSALKMRIERNTYDAYIRDLIQLKSADINLHIVANPSFRLIKKKLRDEYIQLMKANKNTASQYYPNKTQDIQTLIYKEKKQYSPNYEYIAGILKYFHLIGERDTMEAFIRNGDYMVWYVLKNHFIKMISSEEWKIYRNILDDVSRNQKPVG